MSLSIKVSYEIRPWRKNGYRILGAIDAEVAQTCVVTLDPVVQVLHEEIDRTFLPQAEVERLAQRHMEGLDEIVVDVETRDPPEGFSGTELDIGTLTAEQLALALDDYPRKPGVSFETAADEETTDDEADSEEKQSPFAALAGHALAKKDADDPS